MLVARYPRRQEGTSPQSEVIIMLLQVFHVYDKRIHIKIMNIVLSILKWHFHYLRE